MLILRPITFRYIAHYDRVHKSQLTSQTGSEGGGRVGGIRVLLNKTDEHSTRTSDRWGIKTTAKPLSIHDKQSSRNLI